jgi:dihydroflavonol-4-reductase
MTTVLVTGASGFIAKHIVRELLENSYSVKAAVRSEKRQAQVEALFPGADLSFISLDLLTDDGWAEAMVGVDVLLHTASPFPVDEPQDPQELIRPAVDGTLRALAAAQAAGVRRVILTSSCAAIYKDSAKPRMDVSTPANWTDPNHPDTTAYEASKTLAERAAWDFVAEHPEMQLTTINPGAVFGPPMDEHYATSLAYVERFLGGVDPAYPKSNLPIVDVRDVARMHVAAIDSEVAIGKRYPANAGAMMIAEASAVLKKVYPERKITTRQLPDWLVKVVARVNPAARALAGSIKRNLDVEGSAAPRDLGFTYISSADAILASAEYLVANER